MTQTAEFRCGRLAWRFRKSGADGCYAKEYENFDEPTRTKLLELAGLDPTELAAIGCYFDDQNWVLVTDQRLRWSVAGTRKTLALSEIEDATVEPRAMHLAGTKQRLTELTVVTSRGDRHHLQIEAGAPFSGFWNALKMAATWNGPT